MKLCSMKEGTYLSQLLFAEPPVLESESIILRPLQQENAKYLFSISYPEVWTYMFGTINSETEMEKHVSKKILLRNQMTALPFVVVLKETNEIIGSTSIYDINLSQKSCEIGATWYAGNFLGTFVNLECKYLLLKYCFEELKMIRVQFKTDERNIRSQKAIKRLGATKEGILRKERILENGYIRNAVIYSITDDDWVKVKQLIIEKSMRTK